jgi:hypothetical protein
MDPENNVINASGFGIFIEDITQIFRSKYLSGIGRI